ncbi:MAG: glycosyltransferase family 2 protein [Rhodobacterales bacterium]|nr:MAG: glycosyltransferase family 2 protein [Rhodobacterales bacterium]
MTGPIALMSCIRNEGIHVVEWLAYHRVIGFDPIILCTNDCTDGTDHLIDALQAGGAVQHLPNPLGRDQAPQDEGIRRVMARLHGGPVDWLAHLDSDEFLNIAPGAAPVQDMVAQAGAAHAIALPWLNFGDNGHGAWPGETLPAFTACEAEINPDLVKFKSIFRVSAFHHASEHMPTDPRIEAPRAVNAAGEALGPGNLLGPPRARYRPVDVAMRGGAVVNHYATRSTDVFLMKNDRGFGTGKPFGKYHLNSAWHRRINRNDREDRTILRRWDEVAAEMARLRALPGVAGAEADCLAWFQTTRQRLLVPATIRRWTKALPDERP